MIDTARVFRPLLEPARFKGAFGGRGSGKSHFFAELLVDEALAFPGDHGEGLRAVCIREVQKTLKESSKKLIEDKIKALGLGPSFRVYTDCIATPGDGLILFQGMADHTAESIKSLEGVHRAWWEEAQTASQRSMDLLRPTIRVKGSQIWWSWNPRFKYDPVDIFLRQDPPPGAIVVRANWQDNPWWGDGELEQERLIDLAGDQDRYRHIWEGDYEKVGDNQFIPAGIVEKAMRAEAHAYAHDELIIGVDVARSPAGDESVICIRRGRDARSQAWKFYRGLDTMELAARVAAEIDRLGPDATFIDVGGVGAGVFDRLVQLQRPVIAVDSARSSDGTASAKTANKRAEMWQRMKDWLSQGAVAIPNDPKLESQLTGLLYKHDHNNAILLERKDDPRRVKLGLPSPDRADALALTFAFPVGKRMDTWQDESEEHGRSEATGY